MKNQVLELLRQEDGYISGQELCERFQVSRTAVWKIVNQLKEEGYGIEAVKNRGYRLVSVPDLVTEAEIQSCLHTEVMGRNCVYFAETDSTNIQIRRLAEEGAPNGTLAVADYQTAGKGRRGRGWSSKAGEDIFMSLLLRPQMNPANASMLTLVMGLAGARACQELLLEQGCQEQIQIKWPNDLVWRGRKICGILTEMGAEMEVIQYLAVGIGINVNAREFPREISDKAASLCMALGYPLRRAEVIARVLYYFERDYQVFLQTEDLSGLVEDYTERLVNCGRQVQVMDPGKEYTGIARGINSRGELLVEVDGETRQVYAGEVSVRGIYGYI
ncbi:MAG: biotin--[acetyl-CoA-carboxylase] ligase [Lachnospiraceae bacterium]|nr:biotin--[acetyl-CoA-carboxylase] ligase [Lachnospiraceae bacterium]